MIYAGCGGIATARPPRRPAELQATKLEGMPAHSCQLVYLSGGGRVRGEKNLDRAAVRAGHSEWRAFLLFRHLGVAEIR
jgi:hypothetical protein